MNEEKLKLYLGQKIKQFRNNLKLTQEEFSEKIGITQRQVSLIELGKSFPKPDTLSNIANVFNCSMSDLFDFEPISNILDLKKELLKVIENLPEEKLKSLYIIGKNI